MRYRDLFLVALRGLRAHRMRSLLTILGVVIGVAAVISLMSLGAGAQQMVATSIEALGTNLLFVYPGAPVQGGVRGQVGTAANLTLEDAWALADPERAPAVALVAAQANTFAQVVAGGQNLATQIRGVTPEFQYLRNYALAEGEFISPRQVESQARVAVLGNRVAQTLFGGASPLGEWLRVGSNRFQVIGVLESKGGAVMGIEDDMVLVPITTFQARVARQLTARGELALQQITVQATSREEMEAAKEQVATILRERHRILGEDDFSIITQEDMISTLGGVMGMFTIFLGGIAGISLLVSGIGIMNIMLVSVTERTREIGIRKAVGAKRRHILLQFLLEAIFLSLAGGMVGILLGWGIARLISGINLQGQTLQAVVTSSNILLAFSLAAAIGIFFGLYPASRASRLDPIQALRYE